MTNPRPKAGRPSALEDEIDVPTANGTMIRVTVEDRIVELMRTGAHVDTAAASIGVMRNVLHDWLRIGARSRRELTRFPDATLSPHQTRCVRFSIAVDQAQAEWLLRQEALLEAAGRTRKRVVTTQKADATGQIVETSTRTEDEGPDMATVRWRLERHPASRETYGVTRVEHTGPDGEAIPVELRAQSLAEKIAAIRNPEPEDTPQ